MNPSPRVPHQARWVARIRSVSGVDANFVGADPVYSIDLIGPDGLRTLDNIRPANRNFDTSSGEPFNIKAMEPGRRVQILMDGDEWEFWINETLALGPCE